MPCKRTLTDFCFNYVHVCVFACAHRHKHTRSKRAPAPIPGEPWSHKHGTVGRSGSRGQCGRTNVVHIIIIHGSKHAEDGMRQLTNMEAETRTCRQKREDEGRLRSEVALNVNGVRIPERIGSYILSVKSVQVRCSGRGHSSSQVNHLAAVVAGLVDSATVATVTARRPHHSGRRACMCGCIMVVVISRRGGTAALRHQVAGFPAQAAHFVPVGAVAHLRGGI